MNRLKERILPGDWLRKTQKPCQDIASRALSMKPSFTGAHTITSGSGMRHEIPSIMCCHSDSFISSLIARAGKHSGRRSI